MEFDLAPPNSHAKICKVTNTLYMTVAMFTAKTFLKKMRKVTNTLYMTVAMFTAKNLLTYTYVISSQEPLRLTFTSVTYNSPKLSRSFYIPMYILACMYIENNHI